MPKPRNSANRLLSRKALKYENSLRDEIAFMDRFYEEAEKNRVKLAIDKKQRKAAQAAQKAVQKAAQEGTPWENWTGQRTRLDNIEGRNWATFICFRQKNVIPSVAIELINQFLNWLPAGCWKNGKTNCMICSAPFCAMSDYVNLCSWECIERKKRNDIMMEQECIASFYFNKVLAIIRLNVWKRRSAIASTSDSMVTAFFSNIWPKIEPNEEEMPFDLYIELSCFTYELNNQTAELNGLIAVDYISFRDIEYQPDGAKYRMYLPDSPQTQALIKLNYQKRISYYMSPFEEDLWEWDMPVYNECTPDLNTRLYLPVDHEMEQFYQDPFANEDDIWQQYRPSWSEKLMFPFGHIEEESLLDP